MAAPRRQSGGFTSPQSNSDTERLRQEVERIVARLRLEFQQAIDAIDTGGGSGAPTDATYVTISANGTLTDERRLVAGANITITDGGANSTVTIASTGGTTEEQVEDWVAGLVTDSASISWVYNDGAGTLTGSVITEHIQDIVGNLVVDTDTVAWQYDDTAGTLSAEVVADVEARWVVVRDIDFAAWPATDFAAGGDGTYALNDGTGSLTWTVVNSANANSGSATNGGFFRRNAGDVGSDAASGLRIFHDPSVNTSLVAATRTAPAIGISLDSLDPDYDPAQDYLAEVIVTRIAASSAGTIPTNCRVTIALQQASGVPTGVGARCAGGVIVQSAAGAFSPWTNTGTSSNHTGITFPTFNVLAVQWGIHQVYSTFAGATVSAGVFPAVDTLSLVGATSTASLDGAAVLALPNIGGTFLWLASQIAASGTGSVDVMFRRLRLLRKRA